MKKRPLTEEEIKDLSSTEAMEQLTPKEKLTMTMAMSDQIAMVVGERIRKRRKEELNKQKENNA